MFFDMYFLCGRACHQLDVAGMRACSAQGAASPAVYIRLMVAGLFNNAVALQAYSHVYKRLPAQDEGVNTVLQDF